VSTSFEMSPLRVPRERSRAPRHITTLPAPRHRSRRPEKPAGTGPPDTGSGRLPTREPCAVPAPPPRERSD
jgi:hypothetical protein